jgi:hypothetical protein
VFLGTVREARRGKLAERKHFQKNDGWQHKISKELTETAPEKLVAEPVSDPLPIQGEDFHSVQRVVNRQSPYHREH